MTSGLDVCPECHATLSHESGCTICPECGCAQTEKKVSQTSFQLKGSGWYVTDYASKKPGTKPPAKKKS